MAMEKIRPLIFAVALWLIIPGCVCTRYVKNIGKTDAVLEAHDVCIDASGNIYIEAELLRRSRNHFDSLRSLGPRYLVLNAPGFQEAVEKWLAKHRTDHSPSVRPEIYASQYQYPTDSLAAEKCTGWYMVPTDLLRRIESSPLPGHLQASQWTRYPRDHYHYLIPVTAGGLDYFVDLNIDPQPWKISEVGGHQEAWAYPLKVLIVPAAIIDVVLFPIQYLLFVQSM